MKVNHYHCPHDCEHPQPFEHEDRRYCAACYFREGIMNEMILCTPAICPGDALLLSLD